MINRITLLLFIGLAWGQVEQDKLVLKDGTRYLGEFSTIDDEYLLGCVFIAVVIYFMSKDGIGMRNFDMGISFSI